MARAPDYRQLQAFVAVFEERNITAAARSIHLSQPALSSSIKLLEETLGTTLFVRLARGVEVTEDARVLYPTARRMIADAEGLSTRFRAQRDRAPLHIGIECDIPKALVRLLINEAAPAIPHLLLKLLDGCQGDARLASEELRCEDELFLPLQEEPYLLAAPSGHPLELGRAAPTSTMSSVSWITCPTHPIHQRLLPLYGLAASEPAAQANSLELALILTSAGRGVTIAPQSLIAEHDGLIGLALPGLELKRRTGLCYSAQALSNPALSALRDTLDRRARHPIE
ncbi:LysR family transcriptional regulator [Pandoraea bronchicola]|uniref:LysR family transcriptional regulator n=1 Tax=Pandoraea bronchicola TaxID=2508287 RepID=A0A5E5BXK7_9BURK|nr:LysR family transcriptional regulator [Pandoraea bronchicola]VVE90529.1 LysR family transcriptional regulator [Pandoraea bronchicola]